MSFAEELYAISPEAAVCWDRDVASRTDLSLYVALRVNDVTNDNLTVFGDVRSFGQSVMTRWWHFVEDPVPHWVPMEIARERGYVGVLDQHHRIAPPPAIARLWG